MNEFGVSCLCGTIACDGKKCNVTAYENQALRAQVNKLKQQVRNAQTNTNTLLEPQQAGQTNGCMDGRATTP